MFPLNTILGCKSFTVSFCLSGFLVWGVGETSHLVGSDFCSVSIVVCSLRFLLHFQLRKWATRPRANDSRSAILHKVPQGAEMNLLLRRVNQWLHLGCLWINGWEAPEEFGSALGWQWAACAPHQKQLWPCGLADETGMESRSCPLGQPHSCYGVSQSWVNLPSLCRSRLWVVQMAVSDYYVTGVGWGGRRERGLGWMLANSSQRRLSYCQPRVVTSPVAKPRMFGSNQVRLCYNLMTGFY